ncbi:hypothetical protein QFZ42_001826 [Variovorax paradoxus]|uniref:hypothetical protein n=1 Tax=Variovorax paradoxus TaxID=34073 RepID=UPI00278EC39D|nr:hypothetical protein [Variovorax paradoxus]MDQ0569992.1 hypothetical protein [Variovorax paradoxus]
MAPSERFHRGAWTFDLYFVQTADPQMFSGVADISLGLEHRIKLVLSKPATTRGEGLALLQAQCFAWVATQEVPSADIDSLDRSA